VKHGQAEFLYLTTTGRRSGLPREIEIWFTERDGRYYVIAEHLDETRWVQNIRADARVRMRVGTVRLDARARVVEAGAEPDLAQAIQQLSEEKYGWGDGLVVEIASAPSP